MRLRELMRLVLRINDEACGVLERLRDEVMGSRASRMAVLGLSFKPETDDVRLSAAPALANRLLVTVDVAA